jgi:hypothetical protein
MNKKEFNERDICTKSVTRGVAVRRLGRDDAAA